MPTRNEFMPPAPCAKVCPIRTTAMQLAQERQVLGITNVMLQRAAKRDCTHVGTVLAKLTREGRLFGASVVGLPKHWFSSLALAQQWEQSTPPVLSATPVSKAPQLAARRRAAAGRPGAELVTPSQPGVPAPVELAPRADRAAMKAVVPPHVVVQHMPSINHDPRYQLPPGARPFGAGFAAAGIGCDVETGQAWGRAEA